MSIPTAKSEMAEKYAVVFVSRRTAVGNEAYAIMADRMETLARQQPGFLGIDSVRDASGLGITVSYWESRESIQNWGRQVEHLQAQHLGRQRWYETFDLYITQVREHRHFAIPTSEAQELLSGGRGDGVESKSETEYVQGNDQQHQSENK